MLINKLRKWLLKLWFIGVPRDRSNYAFVVVVGAAIEMPLNTQCRPSKSSHNNNFFSTMPCAKPSRLIPRLESVDGSRPPAYLLVRGPAAMYTTTTPAHPSNLPAATGAQQVPEHLSGPRAPGLPVGSALFVGTGFGAAVPTGCAPPETLEAAAALVALHSEKPRIQDFAVGLDGARSTKRAAPIETVVSEAEERRRVRKRANSARPRKGEKRQKVSSAGGTGGTSEPTLPPL